MRKVIAAAAIGAYYFALSLLGWGVSLETGGGLKVLWFAFVYVGIPAIIWLSIKADFEKKTAARKQDELGAALREQNFYVSHRCGHGQSGFLIDAKDKRVCFYVREGERSDKWLLGFGDVLGSSVVTDGKVVTTSTRQAGLTRAVVGGLIFGGAGAVVGATTAGTKSTSKNEIVSMTLEVVLDCPRHPVHRVAYTDGAHAKELEFYQTLMELMMLDADIPSATSEADIHDTVRMVKLKVQRDQKVAA